MRKCALARLVVVPMVAVASVIAFMALLFASDGEPITARAAQQRRPLGYGVINADTTWGPGVVTVTSDVVIQNGATLIVSPGTKVVVGTWDVPTDTAPYAGGASADTVEIIVENGRLVADGFYTDTQLITPTQSITFTSGTWGDPLWGGIRILGGSAVSESVISYAIIEQAVGGIYVENCSPTVTHAVIRQIYGRWGDNGADGDNGSGGADGTAGSPTGGDGAVGDNGGDGADGELAYGIYITGTASAPWVAFNTIRDVDGGGGGFGGWGGDGGSGGDGYSPSPSPGMGYDGGLGGAGGDGGDGGRGGDGAGIYVYGASPTILANEIEEISGGSGGGGGTGGAGGAGGNGGAGAANLSQQASFPGGDGKDGGAGGNGGATGTGGEGWGIYVSGDAAPDIRGNTLLYINGGWSSDGGWGGAGGDGGAGGNAGGWSSGGACGSAAPGAAGNGGQGGNGGNGAEGANAAGIYATNETQALVVDSYILGVFGGKGNSGGHPGGGGNGGNGADGSSGSGGGDGGNGGVGGDGGDGGLAVGLRGPGAAPDFRRDTLLSVHGGSGGDGGSGYYRDGGDAGNGGNSSCSGSGGNGGQGGKGPGNGNGGDGGDGVGILSDTTVDVENNVVYGIAGGSGGMGGLSYHPEAGDGGPGGSGGNGHDGGPGGNGGDGGGNAADGLGILAEGGGAAPRIVNNTVDRLDRGDEGQAGTPGAGGTGGMGGEIGGANGVDGSAGAASQPGVGGMTIGLYFTADATGDVYNNIIVRAAYTTTNDYYVGTLTNSFGISGTAVANLDYNDVWNWETNYAGITAGTHDISQDPLFADVLCMDCEDYRLQAGSPCIDTAGDAQAPIDDREGILRPQDGDLDDVYVADIGAHEYITGNTFAISCDASGNFTTTDDHLAFAWSSGMCTTCTITTTYTPLAYPAASVGALIFEDLAFALNAVDCHGDPVTDLSPALDLTVHYDDPLPGVDEEALAVYRWDTLAWMWQELTVISRDTASNTITVALDHLSEFALLGEAAPSAPSSSAITKWVAPQGQVDYGNELTYTLVISAAPGTQFGLYDPLEGTTFSHFVAGQRPAGIVRDDNVITGTLEVTPTNQVTVSFVTQVGVPGTVGWTMDVSNRACVYPISGTVAGDCIWSNEVTNEALHPFDIFLPLVMRN